MEDKKFSFRYTNKGIWLFILIIAILATSLSSILDINNFGYKGQYNYYLYRNEIYESISNSLYKDYIDENKDEMFAYYVKCYKIDNYPFTEEYKKLYPNTIVYRDENGQYTYFNYDSKSDCIKDEKNNSDVTLGISNADITEEARYINNYLTNDPDKSYFTKNSGYFIPSSVEGPSYMGNKNKIIVRGHYENGRLDLSEVNNLGKDEIKNLTIINIIRNSIDDVYGNINPKENGIKAISFAYFFDLDSQHFKDISKQVDIQNNLIPTLVIYLMVGLALVVIFASISSYKETSNNNFYKSIEKFPVEIVFACSIFLIVICTSITFIDRFNYDFIVGIFYLEEFISIIFLSIAVIYIVYSLKDIYHKGKTSFVFKNSIILKLARLFISLGKNILREIGKIILRADIFDKKNLLIAYLGILALGFFGSVLFVYDSYIELMMFVWFIFVNLIYYYLKKTYMDIKEISKFSTEISKGNYKMKIEEDKTKFKELAHSLNTIGDNLDVSVSKAIKSERLKTELITNVSHDLKTPLTSIINYSELITDELTSSEDRIKYSKIINEKSHKLKRIIEDLFEISKASSSNVELNIEKINFKQLLQQVIGEWEDKFEEKNLSLKIKLPNEDIFLDLDGNKTSRILDNLMSNIYKYTMDNTRVYIDLYRKDRVILSLKNISKYPLNISSEELLERFTRGDSSRNTEGSGLGLSIAHSLTIAQKGEFTIDIDGDLFKTIIKF